MPQLTALTGYVETMPTRARMLWGGGFIVVVGLAVAIAWFFRGDDSTLFARPLDPVQLTEVRSRLTEWDIPFHETLDNVSVESSKKRDVMLRLITAGVPHQHVATSADTLKDVNAMTPDSVLEAQKLQGLQGDLSSDLRGITGVLDATVRIALAQRGFYVDEASHDTSASVQLTLDEGVKLPPDAIAGMRAHVAGAVPGLSPEHVQIMDQTGHDLTTQAVAQGPDDLGLESRLQAALDRLYGPNQAFVRASVETETSSSTSHEIKRIAIQDKPIATDADREHYVSKNKSYDKVHQNVDRGSDTIETNTQTVAGGIKRESIAVFVSDRLTPQPSIPQITAAFAAAAGIDVARGDTIRVQSIHFEQQGGAPAPAPAPSGSAAPQAMLASFGGMPLPILILGIASLIAFSVAGWSMWPQLLDRDGAHLAATKLAADEFEPVRIYAALREEPPHTAAAILASLPSPTTTAVLELYNPEERREIIKRLTKQVSPIVRDVSVQAGRA